MLVIFVSYSGMCQNTLWAASIGGNAGDQGNMIYTDNKGFVYVVGYFAGSNVDFDPSPAGTALLSSNAGSRDGFVAKYTENGQYLWSFKIGGTNLDEVSAISVDPQGNVYVNGFFRGQGVDFDPSPTGTALLNSNGEGGGDPGYGGDVFVAKYNSSGQYLWAFNIGGPSLGDNGTVIVTDQAGNVYTGGYFNASADFDPSANTKILDASNGVVFLAKYNTDGKYQWAFNFGERNGNSHPFGLKIDASANLYVAGYIIGTGLDFDPAPGSTAILNSNGMHDIFLAKYNSAGQYQWANNIGGAGADVARDIDLDESGNIYLAGDFQYTVDFDPSAKTANLTSAGGADIFIAKYDNDGKYQWAKRFGSSSSDIAWGVAYTTNNVYLTGSYQGVVNFSPGPAADNLTSNGGSDIYLTKFDANGNYVCAFGVGGAGTDEARRMDADLSGNLYVTGAIGSANIDFDPSAPVKNLSANGINDVFAVKYNWPDNPKPAGTITGSNTCNGQPATLTFTATAGTGPFTIEYSTGANLYTKTDVVSGQPFNINPPGSATTVYTLVSIKDATKCAATNNVTGITTTVTTSSTGTTDFTFSQNPCDPKTIQFFSAQQNVSNVTWDFGNGVNNSRETNPVVSYSDYGNYTVSMLVTNGGCTASVTKELAVSNAPKNIISTGDTTICSAATLHVVTDSGFASCWKSSASINNPETSNLTIAPLSTSTYYLSSMVPGANIVTNSDFSLGNNAFFSDYMPATTNSKQGEYAVVNVGRDWNGSLCNCGDHTTGTGKMMVINGTSIAGATIWSQKLSVDVNTNYGFLFWAQSLAGSNAPNLKFSINGIVLPNDAVVSGVLGEWQQFHITWNSGSLSSITISIINNSTTTSGNYFALDDIYFGKVAMVHDSVTVTVTQPPLVRAGADTVVCSGAAFQLNGSGASFYHWSPATGLSDVSIKNPVATPAVATSYILSGYNTPNCIGRDTVQIGVLKGPEITLTNDTTICAGSRLQLSAGGGTKYQWSSTPGLDSLSIRNPIVSPVSATTYFVQVSNSAGCNTIDSVVVQVAEKPVVSTINDTTVCKGAPITLRTSSSAKSNYSWSPATDLSNSNIPDPIARPASTHTYVVTASTIEGCTASDSVRIAILDLPTVSTSGNASICAGSKTNLMARGGSSYLWTPSAGLSDNNISNPVAAPQVTTTYLVSVAGVNGCSNQDSLKITVRAKPVFSISPRTATICREDPLLLTATGGDDYQWLNVGSAVTDKGTVTLRPDTSFVYSVRIHDSVCDQTDTLRSAVTVRPLPVINIQKSNDIDCTNSTARLSAGGGNTYVWSPVTGLSNNHISNPTVSPRVTTLYTVKVSDGYGCSSVDSMLVSVNLANNMNGYNLPNAFTPNQDGLNDCFGIKSWGFVEQLEFSIFNRWGVRVFYTKDPAACWDGTFGNLPQDTGTYVYYITAQSTCGGSFTRKGTFVLIR